MEQSSGRPREIQEHYFTFDGHGSTRVLLDVAGAAAQLFAYDAYGQAIGFNPADALTEFLYSGEQFDAKIGQQYLRARYYDPATGRFNRNDPFFGNLTDPQSLHNYLYCHADPVNYTDPNGEVAIFWLLGTLLAGGLVGLGVGEFFVDSAGDALRTALLGGLVISNPVFGAGFLLGLYLSSWNWGRNSDYANVWNLLYEAEALYDSGDRSMITSNINKRPSVMFYDLRWGNGEYYPRNYYFGICPMTLALRKHTYIMQEKEIIKAALKSTNAGEGIPSFSDINNGRTHEWFKAPLINYLLIDPIVGAIDLIGSYQPFFTGSDAYEARLLQSFLGSFTYNWEIKSVDWEQKEATVRFRAGNGSGVRSLTRIPCTSVSIFGDQNTGWFATTTQFFMWEEVISFEE